MIEPKNKKGIGIDRRIGIGEGAGEEWLEDRHASGEEGKEKRDADERSGR